jgi:hypothetical protein
VWNIERMFDTLPGMEEEALPAPELVENQRRSLAMSPHEGLDHDAALRVLGWLVRALTELRRLRRR